MNRFKVATLGVLLALAGCSPAPTEPGGLVIVNARVIDGSGGPSRDVNVRVIDDRIATVGNFEPNANDRIVDAGQLVLAPGFIDSHSHHDSDLLEMTDALAAVNQGITTIIGGQDGGQEYPLAEFFAGLEATPATVNVASFAGHGTLRGVPGAGLSHIASPLDPWSMQNTPPGQAFCTQQVPAGHCPI